MVVVRRDKWQRDRELARQCEGAGDKETTEGESGKEIERLQDNARRQGPKRLQVEQAQRNDELNNKTAQNNTGQAKSGTSLARRGVRGKVGIMTGIRGDRGRLNTLFFLLLSFSFCV